MSRRRIAEALLASVGGLGLASAADAQERRRTRQRGAEESLEAYQRRTGGRLMDPIETDALRRDLRESLRGVRARAVYDRNDALRERLNEEGVAAILRGDQHIRLSQARAAIEAIAEVDPSTARRLRAQLARHEPKRDRDVDERFGAAAGGLAGVLGGLAATGGRGGGARRALARALGATALGAAGAGAGAAAQNASEAVLTSTDASDIGKAAAVGGAAALSAAGARRLVRGAVRRAAIRAEQRAAMRPDVNPRLPYFQRQAAEKRAEETARRAARSMRTDDASLLTPAIAHMERVIEAAGRGRRVTGRTSLEKLRRQVARAKSRGDFREAADALNREYANVIEELGLTRAARLDLDNPEVVTPKALRALERRVTQAIARRAEIRAEIEAMRRPGQIEAQLAVLEQKKGRLSPDEAFAKRLLTQRLAELASRQRQALGRRGRSEDQNPRYLQ